MEQDELAEDMSPMYKPCFKLLGLNQEAFLLKDDNEKLFVVEKNQEGSFCIKALN